ncbi:MAG: fold metallo-hydrolase [Herbinix sp.]|jgi:flavorubredoxin|nr:fold metallo-hydrolase [Herbinix sp.]
MSIIYNDLYQFSSYIPPINLSFHQYLLLTEEPVLVHTGTITQAEKLVPQLKEVLGDKQLKYIFVSHFESDECGGLSLLLRNFPDVKTVCSEITARQLIGFGITEEIIIKKPGEKLISKDYEFEIINYPSEMHLWEGILFMENKRGIFFSGDLIFSLGDMYGQVIEGDWQKEIDNIAVIQIPNTEQRFKVQQDLSKFNPKFAAVGHGSCLKF